jgi:GNAT superfamily N-acetyltransferase
MEVRDERLDIRPLKAGDAQVLDAGFAEMGWTKPASQYVRYLDEQASGSRTTLVAEWEGRVAGYVTIVWESQDPVFRERRIPEVKDLNVLKPFRRKGIGNGLMESAEAAIAERGQVAGLGVGLHSGYGSAQRLYVRRGYLPDGAGVVLNGQAVPEGTEIRLDDEPALRMTKRLT